MSTFVVETVLVVRFLIWKRASVPSSMMFTDAVIRSPDATRRLAVTGGAGTISYQAWSDEAPPAPQLATVPACSSAPAPVRVPPRPTQSATAAPRFESEHATSGCLHVAVTLVNVVAFAATR